MTGDLLDKGKQGEEHARQPGGPTGTKELPLVAISIRLQHRENAAVLRVGYKGLPNCCLCLGPRPCRGDLARQLQDRREGHRNQGAGGPEVDRREADGEAEAGGERGRGLTQTRCPALHIRAVDFGSPFDRIRKIFLLT